MKKFFSFIVLFVFALFSCLIFATSAFALDNAAFSSLSDTDGPVLCMSYRGDTLSYPPNTLKGIRSAVSLGADMVSVSVKMTSDGVLVLCEDKPLSTIAETEENDIGSLTYKQAEKLRLYNLNGTLSSCTVTSLEKAIKAVDGKAVLVLDGAWELRDEVFDLCQRLNDFQSVIIRTKSSSKQIVQWTQSKGENCPKIIGIYSGGIIFNAVTHIKRLSNAGQPAVQYQSGNYFNTFYGSLVSRKYSAPGFARAVAPMYDKNLCGQRNDSTDGWDEMIYRGFTVIETNNTAGLADYIDNSAKYAESLFKALQTAKEIDLGLYTSVSSSNLAEAVSQAEKMTQHSSLSEIQKCLSNLTEAMQNLSPTSQNDTLKGSLNITAGKVAAVVIFGALIFAAEVYIIKMKKKK